MIEKIKNYLIKDIDIQKAIHIFLSFFAGGFVAMGATLIPIYGFSKLMSSFYFFMVGLMLFEIAFYSAKKVQE